MKHPSILRKSAWILLGVLLSGAFLSCEVLASGMRVGLDYLVEKSDLVLSGTVVGSSSYRDPSFLMEILSSDGEGNTISRVESVNQILTDTEIEVSDVISGSYDNSVINLTNMGGTVGSISESHSDTFFSLTPGSNYILFLLYEKRNNKWWTVGGKQGVFEEGVIGSNVFRTVYGERLTVEQLKSRIRAITRE